MPNATRQKRGFAFDFAKAIPAAWELLWADNMKQRNAGNDFRGRTYYLTARDVEEQVRAFAQNTVDGKPWTKERAFGGYGFSVRLSGDLQSMVRSWLLCNPKITGHNFGRGHVSGMRYRPVGEPIGPSEQKTIAKKIERKANPKLGPVHYAPTYSRALCVTTRLKKQGRHSWGSPNWRVLTESDWGSVTCKQCLNLRPVEQTV